jgi:hypothetical protein
MAVRPAIAGSDGMGRLDMAMRFNTRATGLSGWQQETTSRTCPTRSSNGGFESGARGRVLCAAVESTFWLSDTSRSQGVPFLSAPRAAGARTAVRPSRDITCSTRRVRWRTACRAGVDTGGPNGRGRAGVAPCAVWKARRGRKKLRPRAVGDSGPKTIVSDGPAWGLSENFLR